MTKQYPTYLENYFKGFETIRELYWEALRAPTDAVNFRRNPYLREMHKKRFFGRTKDERVAKIAELKKMHADRLQEMELEEKAETEKQQELTEKHIRYAQDRKKLGFIDLETTADGKTVVAEQVEDPTMDELTVNSTRYQKQVQEQRARKKIDIVAPIQGISRKEHVDAMLKPDEHYKDV